MSCFICIVPVETSANSLHFQIYLLEGLHRWNQDSRNAALATGPSSLHCYSDELVHCVNRNYEKLFGKKVVPEFRPPSRYTGKNYISIIIPTIGIRHLSCETSLNQAIK